MRNHILQPVHCYSFVTVHDSERFAVAQVLTEKIGKLSALDFLMVIVKNNVPPPDQIIVEYSSDLLAGISLGINRMTLDYYIILCFEFIDTGSPELPDTAIQTDFSKLIASMSFFFGDKPCQVLKFYQNGSRYPSAMQDWKMFQEGVKHIIALSTYPYQNAIIQTHLDSLKDNMRTDYPDVPLVSQTTFQNDIFFPQPSDILKEFEQHLYNEVFKPFIHEFPLWTNIFTKPKNLDPFGIITKTSDSYVSTLLELKNPVPIPVFFEKSITAVQTNMKFGRDLDETLKSKMTRIRTENRYRSLSYEERWRDRNASGPADPFTDDLDKSPTGDNNHDQDLIDARGNVAKNVLSPFNDQQKAERSQG
ncbi:hypothetical protein QAD02_007586 [Eretmocerus hayati]|uniref:Uncharacterized protein n=1 Tax=Eretmocerus hayati TaxID=131215 RepID=A0ACC2N4D6_9HYME|nr:hypothetical protein QAD02_007586 [Eretmocerus hayati]